MGMMDEERRPTTEGASNAMHGVEVSLDNMRLSMERPESRTSSTYTSMRPLSAYQPMENGLGHRHPTSQRMSTDVRNTSNASSAQSMPQLTFKSADLRSALHLHEAQKSKLYMEGYLLVRHAFAVDGQPAHRPDQFRTWTECFVQLNGTVLSIWESRALAEAEAQGKEVPPSFINITDALVDFIGLHVEAQFSEPGKRRALYHVFAVNSAGSNRVLFCFSTPPPCESSLVEQRLSPKYAQHPDHQRVIDWLNLGHRFLQAWINAIRLASWERSRLDEIYTGALIRARLSAVRNMQGSTAQQQADHAELLVRSPLVRGRHEGWVRARFMGSTEWRMCWMVLQNHWSEEEPASGLRRFLKRGPGDRSSLLSLSSNSSAASATPIPDMPEPPAPPPGTLASPAVAYFYESKKAKKPFASLWHVRHVYAVYPSRPDLVEGSVLFKVEGSLPQSSVLSATHRPRKTGWVMFMPELRAPQTRGANAEMMKWIIAFMDAFRLYGRPGSFAWDARNPTSPFFAYPIGPYKDHLFLDRALAEFLDVTIEDHMTTRQELHDIMAARMRGENTMLLPPLPPTQPASVSRRPTAVGRAVADEVHAERETQVPVQQAQAALEGNREPGTAFDQVYGQVGAQQYDAKAEAKAQAEYEAQAKAKAEYEAQAKAQAEAQVKAQAEYEAQAKAQAEYEAQAKAQAEYEAQAKAQAEYEAQAKAKAEYEAQAKAKAEYEAQIEYEAQRKAQRAHAEAREQAAQEAMAWERAEKEARARNVPSPESRDAPLPRDSFQGQRPRPVSQTLTAGAFKQARPQETTPASSLASSYPTATSYVSTPRDERSAQPSAGSERPAPPPVSAPTSASREAAAPAAVRIVPAETPEVPAPEAPKPLAPAQRTTVTTPVVNPRHEQVYPWPVQPKERVVSGESMTGDVSLLSQANSDFQAAHQYTELSPITEQLTDPPRSGTSEPRSDYANTNPFSTRPPAPPLLPVPNSSKDREISPLSPALSTQLSFLAPAAGTSPVKDELRAPSAPGRQVSSQSRLVSDGTETRILQDYMDEHSALTSPALGSDMSHAPTSAPSSAPATRATVTPIATTPAVRIASPPAPKEPEEEEEEEDAYGAESPKHEPHEPYPSSFGHNKRTQEKAARDQAGHPAYARPGRAPGAVPASGRAQDWVDYDESDVSATRLAAPPQPPSRLGASSSAGSLAEVSPGYSQQSHQARPASAFTEPLHRPSSAFTGSYMRSNNSASSLGMYQNKTGSSSSLQLERPRQTFVRLDPEDQSKVPQGLLASASQERLDRSVREQEARGSGQALVNMPSKPPPPQAGLMGAIHSHDRRAAERARRESMASPARGASSQAHSQMSPSASQQQMWMNMYYWQQQQMMMMMGMMPQNRDAQYPSMQAQQQAQQQAMQAAQQAYMQAYVS